MKYLLPKGSKVYNVFWASTGENMFYRDSHLDDLDNDIGVATETDTFYQYNRDITMGMGHPFNKELIWVGHQKSQIAFCVAKRDMVPLT